MFRKRSIYFPPRVHLRKTPRLPSLRFTHETTSTDITYPGYTNPLPNPHSPIFLKGLALQFYPRPHDPRYREQVPTFRSRDRSRYHRSPMKRARRESRLALELEEEALLHRSGRSHLLCAELVSVVISIEGQETAHDYYSGAVCGR